MKIVQIFEEQTYNTFLKKYAESLLAVAIREGLSTYNRSLYNSIDVKNVVELTGGESYNWDEITEQEQGYDIPHEDTVGAVYIISVIGQSQEAYLSSDSFNRRAVKTGDVLICIDSTNIIWKVLEGRTRAINKNVVLEWDDNDPQTHHTNVIATVGSTEITAIMPENPALGDVNDVKYGNIDVLQSNGQSGKKKFILPLVRYNATSGEVEVVITKSDGTTSVETLVDGDSIVDMLTKGDCGEDLAELMSDSFATKSDVEAIEELIPSGTTTSNKLTHTSFVNSSIATATATFQGYYHVIDDLGLTATATNAQIEAKLNIAAGQTGAVVSTVDSTKDLNELADNNDYLFVGMGAAGGQNLTEVRRFKYNGDNNVWTFEYTLNNSGFTAAQWEAINSLITSSLVTKLTALPTNSELTTLLNGKQNTISDLATIRSGAAAGATAYQKPITGIPDTDLSTGVQTSLDKADTAVQPAAISGMVESTDVHHIVVLTQNEYDALTIKDANTEYNIIEDTTEET